MKNFIIAKQYVGCFSEFNMLHNRATVRYMGCISRNLKLLPTVGGPLKAAAKA